MTYNSLQLSNWTLDCITQLKVQFTICSSIEFIFLFFLLEPTIILKIINNLTIVDLDSRVVEVWIAEKLQFFIRVQFTIPENS